MDNLPIISEVTEVTVVGEDVCFHMKEISDHEGDEKEINNRGDTDDSNNCSRLAKLRTSSPLHYADCDETTTGHCNMCRKKNGPHLEVFPEDDTRFDLRYDSTSIESICLSGCDEYSIAMEEELTGGDGEEGISITTYDDDKETNHSHASLSSSWGHSNMGSHPSLASSPPLACSRGSLPLKHFVTMRRDQCSNLIGRKRDGIDPSKRLSVDMQSRDTKDSREAHSSGDPGKPPAVSFASSRSMETLLCGVIKQV